jgi:hypothetical protein
MNADKRAKSGSQISAIMASGVPGKTDFGLMGGSQAILAISRSAIIRVNPR